MDFTRWLTTWLSRHPLKAPSETDRSRFTADVMARVRSDVASRPAAGWIGRFAGWPQFALPLAAAAAVLFAMNLRHPADTRLAVAPVVLAEAPEATDDSWITETMDILNQLDEDLPDEGASGEPSDDQWLEELEMLDEQDLAARS